MDSGIIISASRRTDLPAFYPDWLIRQFRAGFTETVQPYTRKKRIISLSKEHVHSVVLWSKNFAPLLKMIHHLSGYQLFFMFTINDSLFLEPNVLPLERRFEQLDYITEKFGHERLFIRFDPIVHWEKEGTIVNNLSSFEKIAKKGNYIDNSLCLFVQIPNWISHY